MTVVKQMCNCIDYEVEYDYGIDQILCLDCFEKQDSETQLYRYFTDKCNEQLILEQIQKRTKQNN